MAEQIDIDEALPLEVQALRDRGISTPAFFIGSVYTGNGGTPAQTELKEELRAIPPQAGDEVPEPDPETAV